MPGSGTTLSLACGGDHRTIGSATSRRCPRLEGGWRTPIWPQSRWQGHRTLRTSPGPYWLACHQGRPPKCRIARDCAAFLTETTTDSAKTHHASSYRACWKLPHNHFLLRNTTNSLRHILHCFRDLLLLPAKSVATFFRYSGALESESKNQIRRLESRATTTQCDDGYSRPIMPQYTDVSRKIASN